MRDLEKQIADWRATMARPAGCREDLLDELEEHLREEIEHLRRSGIPAGDVFERAVSKLGAPGPVGAEFAKLASSGRVWMPVKIARILVGTMAAALVPAALLLPNSRGVLLLSHAWCVTLGYSIMFTIGGLSIYDVCARWFGEPRRAQRESLLRAIFQFADLAAVLIAVGVILGMFWTKTHWGRYWAWDPKETGAFLIFGCAVLLSALRWIKPRQTIVVSIGILGNVATAWGWFGANAPAEWTVSNPFLVVFICGHLMFLLAGAFRGVTGMKPEQAQR